MRIKLHILITVMLLGFLIGEVCYLKILPFSFVKIYYTSELKDFNKQPTKAMTVELDGYMFNYHVPHDLKQDVLYEIKELLHGRDLNSIHTLVIIANWVRSKLKFGVPDYDSENILVEDILNSLWNNDLNVLCDSYARLFVIACQSLDISSRIVELEGHVVAEAFVRTINRWVMIDTTRGYYMSKDGEPLSVAEIVVCYTQGVPLIPTVFSERRDDDSLYGEAYEIKWREVYLNGHTFISDKNRVDVPKIFNTIKNRLQLPVVKIQFVDHKSVLIGYKEKIVRRIIFFNFIVLVIVLAVIILNSWRKRMC